MWFMGRDWKWSYEILININVKRTILTDNYCLIFNECRFLFCFHNKTLNKNGTIGKKHQKGGIRLEHKTRLNFCSFFPLNSFNFIHKSMCVNMTYNLMQTNCGLNTKIWGCHWNLFMNVKIYILKYLRKYHTNVPLL